VDLIANSVYVGAEMDEVSVLGFGTAFVTLVLLLYRREIKTRWPVLGLLYGILAGYTFWVGAWPVGFVLISLAVVEFSRGCNGVESPEQLRVAEFSGRQFAVRDCESRLSRMFGP
jgi:hypothetical protein